MNAVDPNLEAWRAQRDDDLAAGRPCGPPPNAAAMLDALRTRDGLALRWSGFAEILLDGLPDADELRDFVRWVLPDTIVTALGEIGVPQLALADARIPSAPAKPKPEAARPDGKPAAQQRQVPVLVAGQRALFFDDDPPILRFQGTTVVLELGGHRALFSSGSVREAADPSRSCVTLAFSAETMSRVRTHLQIPDTDDDALEDHDTNKDVVVLRDSDGCEYELTAGQDESLTGRRGRLIEERVPVETPDLDWGLAYFGLSLGFEFTKGERLPRLTLEELGPRKRLWRLRDLREAEERGDDPASPDCAPERGRLLLAWLARMAAETHLVGQAATRSVRLRACEVGENCLAPYPEEDPPEGVKPEQHVCLSSVMPALAVTPAGRRGAPRGVCDECDARRGARDYRRNEKEGYPGSAEAGRKIGRAENDERRGKASIERDAADLAAWEAARERSVP